MLELDKKVFFFYFIVGFALIFSIWFINAGYLGVTDNNDPNSYTSRIVSVSDGLLGSVEEPDIYKVSEGLEGIFIGYEVEGGSLVIKVDDALLAGDAEKLDNLLELVLDLLVDKDLLVIDKGIVESI